MGTYDLEHLIHEWGHGRLTEEQAIGQVLLMIRELRQQLAEIERRLLRLEQLFRRP